MPNGFLNISHNFAGELQYIICEWVKSTAQGTPVIGHVTGTGLGAQNDTDQTQVFYPAPHVNEQLQVINITEQWHLVRFWRSADGISKDVLLLELAGNARTGALFPIQRYEYVVDRGEFQAGVWADPIEGDKGIRDTRLFEKAYWVEERGTASLLSTEIVDRSDEGGGFDFTDAFKEMNSGGVYVVYVINKVTQGGDDDSGLIVTDDDVYMLLADETYNPITMGGRTIISNFSTTIGTLTMGPLNVAPDSRFILQTHTGLQRNVVFQLGVGDVVIFRKQGVNKIILGEGEELEILIKDNVMYVLNHVTNHDRLGEQHFTYKKTTLNGLSADGSLLVLANYPRVAELLDSLEPGSIVNEITWQTLTDGRYFSKRKWMREGLNFRPPDLRNDSVKALSVLDGSIPAGRFEKENVLEHNHLIGGGNDDGAPPYLSTNHGSGSNNSYNFRSSSLPPLPTFRSGGVIVNGVANSIPNNIVNNVGLYPIIII